jgi:hypothetical protein
LRARHCQQEDRWNRGASGIGRTYNPSVNSCEDGHNANYRQLLIILIIGYSSWTKLQLSSTDSERDPSKKSPLCHCRFLGLHETSTSQRNASVHRQTEKLPTSPANRFYAHLPRALIYLNSSMSALPCLQQLRSRGRQFRTTLRRAVTYHSAEQDAD